MKRTICLALLIVAAANFPMKAQKIAVDYVNPFIGTSNFGTCNPGALVPNGMMSATPFNVMGSDLNHWDKDKRWWSTPYSSDNVVLTGFSHVNLSGVGCPDMGSLLLMPTSGELCVDYRHYGSEYGHEKASPGYYATHLNRYGIDAELTATTRTARARFSYHKGQAHVLLNLGEGLTNETGAMVRRVSEREIEGCKLLGNFCYNMPDGVFPIYFVLRVNKTPRDTGYWKKQRPMQAEAEWDKDAGGYKIYRRYAKELSGDDIGYFFSFDAAEGEQIEVQMGVSFVSLEGARRNLEQEQGTKSFDQLRQEAREAWQRELSKIEVEGGTDDERTVFYTALYHLLIHPNVMNDCDGSYPEMERATTAHTNRTHYTVFSLWDTYRNTHPLLCLIQPERQLDMVRSMVEKGRAWGWMPKWELYGRETNTMDGDPASIVIADTWLRGLRDFDIETAYALCRKSFATEGSRNFLRPDNDEYRRRGYLAVRGEASFAVSAALEYYMADYALSRLAASLGKTDDAKMFRRSADGWKNYYDSEFGLIRPRTDDGRFLSPFNPLAGQNFEANPGFHEGCAWNYTFYVPFDIEGLAKLMGGKRKFVDKLQYVFDQGLYDPANEPDITYPYLFSQFKGEEWRTQLLTQKLLKQHFKNSFDGLPGNEDTGAMSAWAIYSMMGFYPDCPGDPSYTLTTPVFDRITLHLDPRYYENATLVIEKKGKGQTIKGITMGDKPLRRYRIGHDELVGCGTLTFITQERNARKP